MEEEWAIFTSYEIPSPDRLVRRITTFLRQEEGSWRRHDERHQNVLVDASRVPSRLAAAGVRAATTPSFGEERLPEGMVAVVGRR